MNAGKTETEDEAMLRLMKADDAYARFLRKRAEGQEPTTVELMTATLVVLLEHKMVSGGASGSPHTLPREAAHLVE